MIVVADHGVSFRPHGERRRIEEGNMEEIAFVPLFVKPPGQTEGGIDDRHARTIDIVPTIADILGVEVPWETDGRSLLAGRRGRRRDSAASPPARSSRATPTTSSSGATAVLARQIEQSRRRRRRARPLRHRPAARPARGAAWTGSPRAPTGGPTFTSSSPSDYDPDSPFAPVRVSGRIRGAPGQDIAIAVNGRVVAVTRSFGHDGDTLVSAVTPEDAYRPGENSVRLYVVEGPRTTHRPGGASAPTP